MVKRYKAVFVESKNNALTIVRGFRKNGVWSVFKKLKKNKYLVKYIDNKH